MKRVKGKASPGYISSVKRGKDACITFEKGERIGWESSILPKSSREKDIGNKEIKKGELRKIVKTGAQSSSAVKGGREMAKKLDEACPCGSGKKYGECCGKDEPCSCGSGKKASECCYKTAGKSCC